MTIPPTTSRAHSALFVGLIALAGCGPAMQGELATPASPSACTHGSRATVAAVAGGLAIVGAGVGTGFGVAALNDKSHFDEHPTVARGNAGNDNALYADVAFGSAVILGATSVVLLLTNHDPQGDPPLPTADPNATSGVKDARAITFIAVPILLPQGGGAGALVRF